MIVELVGGAEERPEVRVVHVDDLTRVVLALGEVTDEEADGLLREAGLGRLVDADTAVLDPAALRTAAEPGATAGDWADRWDALAASAADDGMLHVPVQSAAGA
ncbi:hypothetical protein [Trujillonella endophytica]|uniref:Uncharacterized protein n=1 Tax=Trujillonella endophytica TaxID=673521 RepID=A0A1H8W4E9_9ACTN|nr:hypothetical protein [Trujillella endophytica]SEP22484.1 hypothetical protein SAMN05660991_04041 [Trujillella endophytica]